MMVNSSTLKSYCLILKPSITIYSLCDLGQIYCHTPRFSHHTMDMIVIDPSWDCKNEMNYYIHSTKHKVNVL